MLLIQKLLNGVNIIPGSGEYVYDIHVFYNEQGKAINSHNDESLYRIINECCCIVLVQHSWWSIR